jgi:SLT domain-containing protein
VLTNTEKEGLNQVVDNFAILAQHSRAAFAAWKAFSIVNAIIDTYTGAQKAFTSLAGIPIIGPALGAAAAGVAIAAGMMRVNMIRNQQYQGREKGGSVTANTPYIVGERGPELVVPHRGGTVIPNGQLSNAMGGGQVIYNGPYIANMQAIDTQSAQQFLAKNKNSVWAANQSAARGLPASRT